MVFSSITLTRWKREEPYYIPRLTVIYERELHSRNRFCEFKYIFTALSISGAPHYWYYNFFYNYSAETVIKTFINLSGNVRRRRAPVD